MRLFYNRFTPRRILRRSGFRFLAWSPWSFARPHVYGRVAARSNKQRNSKLTKSSRKTARRQ